MKLWMWIVAAMALIATLSISLAVLNSGLEVEVATVQTGKIRETIEEQGKTRLPNEYRVTMPFDGELTELTWYEGDSVTAKQVIGQVSPKQLESSVNEATAAVERLDASIEENANETLEKTVRLQATKFVESMSATVEAAETQIEASQEKMDFTETLLGRALELFQRGALNQEDLDRRQLDHVESQIGFRQDNLIVKSIRAIDAATQLMPTMIDDYLIKKTLQREVLAAQRRESQARLEQALINQEKGRLTSPVDGTILEKHVTGREYLPGGTLVCTIGDLGELEIEAEILTQDALRVEPNAPVELTWLAANSNGDKVWIGNVKQVLPSGFTKISSLGVEQQRVKIRIGLTDEVRESMLQAGVRVGYRIQVKIIVDTADDAVLVPRTALFRDSAGNWTLYRVDRGKAIKTQVDVGVLGDRQAQIVSGVSQGDQIVVAPDQRLSNGSRVKPIKL